MPYGEYAALNDLHDKTTRNFPDTDASESVPSSPPPSSSSSRHPLSPAVPAVVVTEKSKLSYKARHSCARASPLVCPNQELAEQFDVVRRSRALEGEDISALTYARAVAVCEAFISHFYVELCNNTHLVQVIKGADQFSTISHEDRLLKINQHFHIPSHHVSS